MLIGNNMVLNSQSVGNISNTGIQVNGTNGSSAQPPISAQRYVNPVHQLTTFKANPPIYDAYDIYQMTPSTSWQNTV